MDIAQSQYPGDAFTTWTGFKPSTRLADAVVYDAPVLLYYHPTKVRKMQVVGNIFPKELGILFHNSPYRKPVNEATEIRENGTYDRLYGKWFAVPRHDESQTPKSDSTAGRS
jgi:hypothetical protein